MSAGAVPRSGARLGARPLRVSVDWRRRIGQGVAVRNQTGKPCRPSLFLPRDAMVDETALP